MLEELEKLLKKIGGRFIIVEDGKPRYIILDFGEFKRLVGGSPSKEEDSGPPIEIEEPQAEEKDDLMVEDIPLE